MTGEVIALGAWYLGAAALFGVFMWRAFAKLFDTMQSSLGERFDRMERRIDDLTKEHQALAGELSEFRGEMRGRIQNREQAPPIAFAEERAT